MFAMKRYQDGEVNYQFSLKLKRPKLKRVLSKKGNMAKFMDRWVKFYVEFTVKVIKDTNLLQSLCNLAIENSSMIWLKILRKIDNATPFIKREKIPRMELIEKVLEESYAEKCTEKGSVM